MKGEKNVGLDRAKDLLRNAVEVSQKEVLSSLQGSNELLDGVLGVIPAAEVSKEIRGEVLTMARKLELFGTESMRKRSPKISVQEKIEWLQAALKGKKNGMLKADLLTAYASQFGSLRNPNMLDQAIEQGEFSTNKTGKNISVFERKKG